MSTSTRSGPPPAPREPFQPGGFLLAFLFPGLGHWWLGHRARGLAVCGGVLGLFFTGVLVGGIDVVDRKQEPVWFVGQALVGPVAIGVDWIYQSHLKIFDPVINRWRPANPDEYRDPSSGRAASIAYPPGGPPTATLANGTVVAPAYPPTVRSVGRMHDLGLLFGAIAGMMNLIAAVDAGFRRPQTT